MLEENTKVFMKEIQKEDEEEKEDGMKKISKDMEELKKNTKEFN